MALKADSQVATLNDHHDRAKMGVELHNQLPVILAAESGPGTQGGYKRPTHLKK
jgi:hypothetical protein